LRAEVDPARAGLGRGPCSRRREHRPPYASGRRRGARFSARRRRTTRHRPRTLARGPPTTAEGTRKKSQEPEHGQSKR